MNTSTTPSPALDALLRDAQAALARPSAHTAPMDGHETRHVFNDFADSIACLTRGLEGLRARQEVVELTLAMALQELPPGRAETVLARMARLHAMHCDSQAEQPLPGSDALALRLIHFFNATAGGPPNR